MPILTDVSSFPAKLREARISNARQAGKEKAKRRTKKDHQKLSRYFRQMKLDSIIFEASQPDQVRPGPAIRNDLLQPLFYSTLGSKNMRQAKKEKEKKGTRKVNATESIVVLGAQKELYVTIFGEHSECTQPI